MIIEAETIQEAYPQALAHVHYAGEGVEVRGFKTRELLNVQTIIRDPSQHCHVIPGRKWNPWIAMSEALWILAGRDDIKPLLPYNARIRDFSDNGETLYGAYGLRIKDQIEPVIQRLKNDPGDRRAVISIWREEDLWANTKDYPCNDLIMFKLRRNRLHMTVINRSNDLHWGLFGVNLPTFGILQDYVASRLRVELGTQTHFSNSLHIYLDGPGMKPNVDITKNMLLHEYDAIPELPRGQRAFTKPIELDALREACNAILDQEGYSGDIPPFLEFAEKFLEMYRLGEYNPIVRWAGVWPDWMAAAEAWFKENKK